MTKNAKKWIGISAAAVLCIAAAGFAIFFGTRPSRPPAAYVLDVSLGDIQSVSVEGSESYTLSQDASGSFHLLGIEGVPLDQGRMQAAVEQAASLPGRRQRNMEREEMGLAPAQGTVTITTPGKVDTISIGKEADKDTVYVEIDGVFYRANNQILALLSMPEEHFFDLMLTPDLAEDQLQSVTRLSISGIERSEDIVIERQAEDEEEKLSYYVTEPTNYEVSTDILLKQVLAPASGLRASGVVERNPDEKQLKEFGLEQPTYVLRYEASDVPEILYFGTITEDAQFYVQRAGVNVVYTVPVSDVVFLQIRLPDIVSRVAFTRDIESFSNLTISDREKIYAFKATGRGDSLTVRYGETEISSTAFRRFYTSLWGIMIEGEAEYPDQGQPAVVITVDSRGSDKVDVIEYIPLDASRRRYFVSVNGSGLFYVMGKDVLTIFESAEKLANGDSVGVS